MNEYKKFIQFEKDLYSTNEVIPLHAPQFLGNEISYVTNAIKSTFVSSVGSYVDDFESQIKQYTQANGAIAVVNGTSALHLCLYMAGVEADDLVITQALTFVATCNAINQAGASPILLDVSIDSLSLCPIALENFLESSALLDERGCIHRLTQRRIRAVLPMHTFGHPAKLDEIHQICKKWNIKLVEDAAESLGSKYKGKHTGTIGDFAALSFNGNKIITTGGGGMVLCRDEKDAVRIKHLSTAAKVAHPYEFYHDEFGFNYRMPNLNAALGCGQLETLPKYLKNKKKLASIYNSFFKDSDCKFVIEPEYAESNYWLNAIVCPDKIYRDNFLKQTNLQGITTRPVWTLMSNLPMFKESIQDSLVISKKLEETLINIPSSPILSLDE
jgi:aminotransferase in exopolysaccharide biosynthesis